MSVPAATRPVVNVAFVVAATVALALVGWSSGTALPVLRETPVAEALPAWGRAALGVWMGVLAVVSLALPLLALIIWGRHASVRRALLPYALVLAAQILIEATFSSVFVPNLVVLTGLFFTAYRLWQLWTTRRFFSGVESPTGPGRSFVGGLLSLGLVCWAANLSFLLLVALPLAV